MDDPEAKKRCMTRIRYKGIKLYPTLSKQRENFCGVRFEIMDAILPRTAPSDIQHSIVPKGDRMTDKVYNVLFLCTGNSARSIMAEALVTTMGKGRFRGFSAGSHPSGKVNPFAIEQIRSTNYAVDNLRSKSWDVFAAPNAPYMDFIITVCDNAAGETCPYWPGHPLSAHWGFEDPAAAEGTNEEKRAVFHKVFHQIMARVNTFVSLPLHRLENDAIQQEIKAIGETKV